MKNSLVIGEIRGIKIEINASWLIVFGLVTFMLATSFFPLNYPHWDPALFWPLGALMALSLFASVLLHELSHSLVSIRNGIPVKKITLFIFGGVAQIESEPDEPIKELKIAIAGPAMSIFLSIMFSFSAGIAEVLVGSEYIVVPLKYLATVNLVLAIFNMVPAFPLDGGRVLRALIWYFKGDLRSATKTASSIGGFFGYFLIFTGIFQALGGQIFGGLWFVFIGWFINQASQTSYQQTLVTDIFKKIKVREFMTQDVVVVDYHKTIKDLVEDYFYTRKYKIFPVRKIDEIIGVIGLNEIKSIPKDQWEEKLVVEAVRPLTEDMVVSPECTVTDTLKHLAKNGLGRILVMEGDQLLGIVSNTDVLNYIRIYSELEN